MKKTIINSGANLSRRETITMLLSAGLVTPSLLNVFHDNRKSFFNNPLNKMTNLTKKNISMKTIGIIGGLGPQATMDLEMRIHKVAQQLIPQAQNSGYPPMIVQYYRHAPILLTELNQPVVPWQPDPRLLEVAKQLGSSTDFLLIPSNGMHMFQKEIERASARKVISMIEATLEEVKKRGWQKVGVVGLMSPGIYTTRLRDLGIKFETIDDELQEKMNKAIFKVMEGTEDEKDRAIAIEAIEELRRKNVDGIIPGCTEIPLLLGQRMNSTDLLNPAQLLAEKVVRYCIQ